MWGWALAGGLVGGLVAVGLSARKTNRELASRALVMERSMHEGGAALELALAAKGEALQDELRLYAEGLAEDVGRQHLEQRYGIGPTQMQQFAAVGRRLSS